MYTYSSGDIEYFQDPEVEFTFKYFSLWTLLKAFFPHSLATDVVEHFLMPLFAVLFVLPIFIVGILWSFVAFYIVTYILVTLFVIFPIYGASFTHRKTSDIGLSHSNIYSGVGILFKE